MSTFRSVSIVDEVGNVILELDSRGITFTAPNGRKAVVRLERGTDTGTVKLVTVYEPLGAAAIDIVDNIGV